MFTYCPRCRRFVTVKEAMGFKTTTKIGPTVCIDCRNGKKK